MPTYPRSSPHVQPRTHSPKTRLMWYPGCQLYFRFDSRMQQPCAKAHMHVEEAGLLCQCLPIFSWPIHLSRMRLAKGEAQIKCCSSLPILEDVRLVAYLCGFVTGAITTFSISPQPRTEASLINLQKSLSVRSRRLLASCRSAASQNGRDCSSASLMNSVPSHLPRFSYFA